MQHTSHAGQAVYSQPVLRIYDLYVLGFSNTFLWGCPSSRMEAHYNEHLRASHLDVGVGTGYFLDRCRFPAPAPAITLLDLNANSLAHTAARIARYQPATCHADVLAPLPLPPQRFGSIGLNFLLHCLPSGGGGKWRALDHLAPLLTPDGVLFGSTILGDGLEKTWAQSRLMRLYNQRGIFDNAQDSRDTLERALRARFRELQVSVEGVVALFSARGPLSSTRSSPLGAPLG